MLQLGGNRHAQSSADGVGGMAGSEGVVLALCGIGEAAQAVQFAVVVKLVAPARQDLVGIGLVPHVPHQTVVGRVEHIVQRHDNLHRAHTRGKVPRVARQLVYHILPQLVAHLWQLVDIQFPQVGRAVNLCQ